MWHCMLIRAAPSRKAGQGKLWFGITLLGNSKLTQQTPAQPPAGPPTEAGAD